MKEKNIKTCNRCAVLIGTKRSNAICKIQETNEEVCRDCYMDAINGYDAPSITAKVW